MISSPLIKELDKLDDILGHDSLDQHVTGLDQFIRSNLSTVSSFQPASIIKQYDSSPKRLYEAQIRQEQYDDIMKRRQMSPAPSAPPMVHFNPTSSPIQRSNPYSSPSRKPQHDPIDHKTPYDIRSMNSPSQTIPLSPYHGSGSGSDYGGDNGYGYGIAYRTHQPLEGMALNHLRAQKEQVQRPKQMPTDYHQPSSGSSSNIRGGGGDMTGAASAPAIDASYHERENYLRKMQSLRRRLLS